MQPSARLAAWLCTALLVVACAPVEDPGGAPDDQCGATGYQSLVGAPLAAVTLPAELDSRVIRPGEMVTMEYRADRLNISVDEQGTITRVYCG